MFVTAVLGDLFFCSSARRVSNRSVCIANNLRPHVESKLTFTAPQLLACIFYYMLILHKHCFHFLLELQEKLKTMPVQNFGGTTKNVMVVLKKVYCVPNSLVRDILKKIVFCVFLNYEYVHVNRTGFDKK